jgi:hypothetical protein
MSEISIREVLDSLYEEVTSFRGAVRSIRNEIDTLATSPSVAEAVRILNRIRHELGYDPEVAHGLADDVLLALVAVPEVEEAWMNVPKWYA